MRLIDADALIGSIKGYRLGKIPKVELEWKIENAPTIEAAPVVHGRWQWFEEWNPSTPDNPRECESAGWMCGMCKTALEDMVGGYWDNPDEEPNLNYCPNCGAKMDGGVSDG